MTEIPTGLEALAEQAGATYDRECKTFEWSGYRRAILAAVLPEQVRSVQGWMALDLHTALGLPTDHGPDVVHQGRRSWGDWWAELLARVRTLSTASEATRPHFADPDTAALYERLLRALTLVIADDTEDDIREAVHKALTAPVQPATPDTPATETTTGTGGDTGDLSALLESITQAIGQTRILRTSNDEIAAAVLEVVRPHLKTQVSEVERVDESGALRDQIAQTFIRWSNARTVVCEHTQFVEFGTAADAVMDVIRPVLEDYEIRLRNTACQFIKRADRAEQAEAEQDRLKAALAKHRAYLDENFRQWCSPHGVAADYATKLIAQLDAALAQDGQ